MNLIHNRRKANALRLVRNNTLLNRIATIHSKHMAKAKKASHDNFPERDRNCRIYAHSKSMKEIVAGGYGTAKGVLGKEPIVGATGIILEEGTGWIGSEKHKKVIEWKEAKEYGISIEKGTNNQLYYTVIFIKK